MERRLMTLVVILTLAGIMVMGCSSTTSNANQKGQDQGNGMQEPATPQEAVGSGSPLQATDINEEEGQSLDDHTAPAVPTSEAAQGQQGPSPRVDHPNWTGRSDGRFSPDMRNMTPEQRQQFMHLRMQEMTKACQGKAEDDICTMQSPRGDSQGTCKTQNDSLMCVMERDGRQWQGYQAPQNG